jgi:hypothetical protein
LNDLSSTPPVSSARHAFTFDAFDDEEQPATSENAASAATTTTERFTNDFFKVFLLKIPWLRV